VLNKARIVALTAALICICVSPARAADPMFVDWTSLLPGSPGLAYEPSSSDDCVAELRQPRGRRLRRLLRGRL
jgi:hypothetical protein